MKEHCKNCNVLTKYEKLFNNVKKAKKNVKTEQNLNNQIVLQNFNCKKI